MDEVDATPVDDSTRSQHGPDLARAKRHEPLSRANGLVRNGTLDDQEPLAGGKIGLGESLVRPEIAHAVSVRVDEVPLARSVGERERSQRLLRAADPIAIDIDAIRERIERAVAVDVDP